MNSRYLLLLLLVTAGCQPTDGPDVFNQLVAASGPDDHPDGEFMAGEWGNYISMFPNSPRIDEAIRRRDDSLRLAEAQRKANWSYGEDPTSVLEAFRAYLKAAPTSDAIYGDYARRSIRGAAGAYFQRLVLKRIADSPAGLHLQSFVSDMPSPVKDRLYKLDATKALFIEVPDESFERIVLNAGYLAAPPGEFDCPRSLSVRVDEEALDTADYVSWGKITQYRYTVHVTYRDKGEVRWTGKGVSEDPPLPDQVLVESKGDSLSIGSYHTGRRDACDAAGRALAAGLGERRDALRAWKDLSNEECEFYSACNRLLSEVEVVEGDLEPAHYARDFDRLRAAAKAMPDGPLVQDLKRAVKWARLND